jgi:hypothetical protein
MPDLDSKTLHPIGDDCKMSPLCALGAPVKHEEECLECDYARMTDAEFRALSKGRRDAK